MKHSPPRLTLASLQFDDGTANRYLAPGADVARQRQFGFGEVAQAYQVNPPSHTFSHLLTPSHTF